MKAYELERAANAREFGGAAWNMVMSGIENALEDCEDGTPEFERVARASLESNLCFPNDCSEDDLDWFRSMGVSW